MKIKLFFVSGLAGRSESPSVPVAAAGSSFRLVFLETVPAVHRPSLCRFEWYFAFISAVRTFCLKVLFGLIPAVSTPISSASVGHFFSLYFWVFPILYLYLFNDGPGAISECLYGDISFSLKTLRRNQIFFCCSFPHFAGIADIYVSARPLSNYCYYHGVNIRILTE